MKNIITMLIAIFLAVNVQAEQQNLDVVTNPAYHGDSSSVQGDDIRLTMENNAAKQEAMNAELYSKDAAQDVVIDGKRNTVDQAAKDASQDTEIGNKRNTADQATKDSEQDTAIGLNTAKVVITTQQAADIVTNNAKVSYPGPQDITGKEDALICVSGQVKKWTGSVWACAEDIEGEGGTGAQDASELTFATTSNLSSTDTASAIEEVYAKAAQAATLNTAISNNSDVQANTAKVTYPGPQDLTGYVEDTDLTSVSVDINTFMQLADKAAIQAWLGISTTPTYSLTMAITDTTGTGSTFTVNSDSATVANTPKTWAGLDSATTDVTFTPNTTETSSCTGTGLSGSNPNYVADMSSADVTDWACTVSDASSYILNEDYEGDNSANWTLATSGGGLVSLDSTSPSLMGSQSLRLYGASTGTASATSDTFTGETEIHLSALLQPDDFGSDSGEEIVLLSSGVVQASVRLAGASFRVYHGTVDSGWVNVGATIGTAQCLWVDYVAGSGVDGTINMTVDAATGSEGSYSCTKGTADSTIATGTSTGSIDAVRFSRGYGTQDFSIDELKVSASTLGDF